MEIICGIDEAGRGPLAGPVVAACCILGNWLPNGLLQDSKALSHKKRTEIASLIKTHARSWSIGWTWPDEIDRLNIHFATLLAMQRAFLCLSDNPTTVLVDGKFVPDIHVPCTSIIKGDTKIKEIQAASILAKITRDNWMIEYERTNPCYLFHKHKGYPTKEHRKLIRQYGPGPIHRKSFCLTKIESINKK